VVQVGQVVLQAGGDRVVVGEDRVVLGPEVAEHRPAAHTGPVGDRVDRGAVVALAGEQLPCRGGDALAHLGFDPDGGCGHA